MSAKASINVPHKKVNLICIRENGQYISMDSFKYCTRVIKHRLNIGFNYYSLRHTHATLLIERGISHKAVQERLGHDSITTPLQTYVHNTKQMEDTLVNNFENIINNFVHQQN